MKIVFSLFKIWLSLAALLIFWFLCPSWPPCISLGIKCLCPSYSVLPSVLCSSIHFPLISPVSKKLFQDYLQNKNKNEYKQFNCVIIFWPWLSLWHWLFSPSMTVHDISMKLPTKSMHGNIAYLILFLKNFYGRIL